MLGLPEPGMHDKTKHFKKNVGKENDKPPLPIKKSITR